MANQPDTNTVATSFTLPRQLFAAVKRKAKADLTNQSDIVRRALMNYLPKEEREGVLKEIAESDKIDLTKATPVSYKNKLPKIKSTTAAVLDSYVPGAKKKRASSPRKPSKKPVTGKHPVPSVYANS